MKLGSKYGSPAPPHPGDRRLPGQEQPIFGNGFLLDQEQFVGNQFCDVGSSCFAPPDTQLAAGFNEVVELSNDTMRVFSKGGAVLQNQTTYLPSFSRLPTKRRLTAKLSSMRLMAATTWRTCWSIGPERLLRAAKSSWESRRALIRPGRGASTPSASSTKTDGTVLDQPKLGFSDDKIMITDNETGGTPEDTLDILQKSDVLAGCGA